MQSFRGLGHRYAVVPVDVVAQLGAIEAGRGRQQRAQLDHPLALETLRELAVVESIGTSNAIEGITAPATRIAAIAADRAAPRDRSEQEIAGYRHALATVHEHASDMPFEPRFVLQLHGYLYRFAAAGHAGHFKAMDNRVTERSPGGEVIDRFVPLDAARTPAAMDELHESFALTRTDGVVPYPLLCAAYVLDFLVIHPFTDGNGRLARLISVWLLHQGGYGVGRYISLERLIGDTREDYYATLQASTKGWHENRHDVWPWTRYFLGLLVAAYREFDERSAALVSGPQGKREAIVRTVREWPRPEFTAAEIHGSVRGVKREMVTRVLSDLAAAGELERRGAGRGTRWRRLDGS